MADISSLKINGKVYVIKDTEARSKLSKFLDYTGTDFDQLSEIVTYLKNNKASIDASHEEITSIKNILSKAIDSDDESLDQLSEIVAYIKANNKSISGLVTEAKSIKDSIPTKVSQLTWDKTLTKNDVGLNKVDNTADSEKSVKYASNAGTVGGFTVGVSVPANAVFTDTTYGVVSAEADGLAPSFKESNLSKDFDYSSQYLLGNDLKWHLISEGKVYKPGSGISIADDGTISCSIGSLGLVSSTANGLAPALSKENLSDTKVTSNLSVLSSDLKWHQLPSTAFIGGGGGGTGSNILIEAKKEGENDFYTLGITS